MSWAAHEFENYFIQKHVGLKASFLAIMLGASIPDLFTKGLVYASDDAAQFHRGWPGVGFTHSLLFGVVFATAVLAVTRSRNWALGILIGQWAHVLTDVADTAGIMPFFPFSTEPVTIEHVEARGRGGTLRRRGGVLQQPRRGLGSLLARDGRGLRAPHAAVLVLPGRRSSPPTRAPGRGCAGPSGCPSTALLLHLPRTAVLRPRRACVAWFLYARFDARTPLQLGWGGPEYVTGNDLSDAGWLEVVVRTSIGGVLFAGFLWLCWRLFIRRLWQRGYDPPQTVRGDGAKAVFGGQRLEPVSPGAGGG